MLHCYRRLDDAGVTTMSHTSPSKRGSSEHTFNSFSSTPRNTCFNVREPSARWHVSQSEGQSCISRIWKLENILKIFQRNVRTRRQCCLRHLVKRHYRRVSLSWAELTGAAAAVYRDTDVNTDSATGRLRILVESRTSTCLRLTTCPAGYTYSTERVVSCLAITRSRLALARSSSRS